MGNDSLTELSWEVDEALHMNAFWNIHSSKKYKGVLLWSTEYISDNNHLNARIE